MSNTEDKEAPAQLVLCVDAGQTGTRTQLRCDGVTVSDSQHPPVINDRPLLPQLTQWIKEGLHDANASCSTVAIGSSGLKDDDDPEELLTLLKGTGVSHVLLAHDSTSSYLGALGDETGVVVAAGTGVVTLAVGAEAVARVDGWGYLLGDAGSGFWIGRAALDMVMRAHDGRGPQTALSGIIQQDFDNIEEAYLEIQADEMKVSRVASYAKTVAGLASTDKIARQISDAAAGELAYSAIAGLHRVGEDNRDDPRVACLGNVFRNELLKQRFIQLVTNEFPHARFTKNHGNGLDGCYAMTTLAPDSALRQRIGYADAE